MASEYQRFGDPSRGGRRCGGGLTENALGRNRFVWPFNFFRGTSLRRFRRTGLEDVFPSRATLCAWSLAARHEARHNFRFASLNTSSRVDWYRFTNRTSVRDHQSERFEKLTIRNAVNDTERASPVRAYAPRGQRAVTRQFQRYTRARRSHGTALSTTPYPRGAARTGNA